MSEQSLEQLANSDPPELLAVVEPKYPPMDLGAEGIWRLVKDQDTSVGVVWTDRLTSSGFIPINSSDVAHMIRLYFSDSKNANVPASLAYSVFPTYVKNYLDSVELDEEQEGLLSEAISTAMKEVK